MVMGASGEGNQGRFDHPALPIASAHAGSIVLDLSGETLRSQFISAEGTVLDSFKIYKSHSNAATATE
jgi:hypothetical protein